MLFSKFFKQLILQSSFDAVLLFVIVELVVNE